MIGPNLVLVMDSSMADFKPSAVRALRNSMMGAIQVEFLEKLHIKFQNIYARGLPLAWLSSPYLRKIAKRMPGRMAGFHNFEEDKEWLELKLPGVSCQHSDFIEANLTGVDIAAAYISEHLSSMMASNDIINVHDHGIPMDPLMKSVKCNYCGKLVSGFHRLKCHLGAVGNDVMPCLKVPADVKEVFEAVLLEKKINNLKRSLSASKGNVNINKAKTQVDISEGDCLLENSGFKRASSSKKTKFSEVGTSSHENSSEMEVKKSVGRFFYGTGHPFKDVEETFFLEMVSCFFGHGPIMNNIPSLKELKGWILEDSLLNNATIRRGNEKNMGNYWLQHLVRWLD
ncbi:uncharacterized protein [Primulina eburnea]|uniref:uncharacterized protein isoform X2 n=1 Tax=Primulina eburnea TaxID=1245227 RepID=UPI003C6CA60C